MLTSETMVKCGSVLFRWRSYILLIFGPLVLLCLNQPEHVRVAAGKLVGTAFEALCLIAVAAGLVLRALTVGFVPAGTSGRNTSGQIAKVLNTTGIYSVTRNPLYLANCITYMGVILFTQDLMIGLAFGLFLIIYYERIILAEEAYLLSRFGDQYRRWADEVPAFLPNFHSWKAPELRFSARSVLRREYSGWFAAVIVLFVIEVGRDALQDDPWLIDRAWLVVLVGGASVYLLLRSLKKLTGVLDVKGR